MLRTDEHNTPIGPRPEYGDGSLCLTGAELAHSTLDARRTVSIKLFRWTITSLRRRSFGGLRYQPYESYQQPGFGRQRLNRPA